MYLFPMFLLSSSLLIVGGRRVGILEPLSGVPPEYRLAELWLGVNLWWW